MTVRLPSFSKMKLHNLRRLAQQPGLVLASASPRRQRILRETGIPFEVIAPQGKEFLDPELSPAELSVDIACRKVNSIKMIDQCAYLGCDTIVILNGTILTKPVDAADARRILRFLSGQTHTVYTGLALFDSTHNKCYRGFEKSQVSFRDLDDQIIDTYVASGEPLDKAGAYGIQGMGGILVDSIRGNIDNVIGLPLNELERLAGYLLRAYGR